METPAEKYQRQMRENMETLQSILDESEYSFINTDDACGDEIYEIFKKTAEISGGLLNFISGEIKALEDRSFEINIAYNFNFEKETRPINLKYNLRIGIQVPKVANNLNELLKVEGYSGDKYYYDISQDVGMSGIAFTNFIKEYKLFISGTGLIYRGESESENSEGFEYFWAKLNEYESNT